MRNGIRLLATLALALPSLAIAAPGGAATDKVANGSGSSYEALPMDQWITDVQSKGLILNYNPDGTAAGQQDYIDGKTVDFVASDLPFRVAGDKLAGLGPQKVPWGFSYVPGVAVGTAFLYHISVDGHLVTNLRLSGQTLLEIFTGRITNWDNPQITRDYGHKLPDLTIRPVIHEELSGLTYYFTYWMSHEFPDQWNAFCRKVDPGISLPCGATEVYPQFGHAQGEEGSNEVADYVTSADGNGAIGYVETPYAAGTGYPVLELGNAAGKYVRPAPPAVTTALSLAEINENPSSPDYLQEDLNNVYASKNPAVYPLSSYSYVVVPRAGTKLPPVFTTSAGRTLSGFLGYTLCAGQSQLPKMDIPKLPANLQAGGLLQVKDIPGHGSVPAHCP
ncbi:MAG TPA: substrate-binding domain-containing protein [Streptosporangiaceae bacterium]|jgi:ABC-type phosphate transport system substrate-binding protein